MHAITTLINTQVPFDAAKNRALNYITHSRRSLNLVSQYLKTTNAEANRVLDALIEDGKIEKLTVTNTRLQRKIVYALKDDLAILEIPMFRVAIPYSRAKPRKIDERHVQGGGFGSAPHSYTGGMYGLLTTSD